MASESLVHYIIVALFDEIDPLCDQSVRRFIRYGYVVTKYVDITLLHSENASCNVVIYPCFNAYRNTSLKVDHPITEIDAIKRVIISYYPCDWFESGRYHTSNTDLGRFLNISDAR